METEKEESLTQDEIDNSVKGSKYLITAQGYKSKFDVVDILTSGNIPNFENTADKLVCAIELGQLIRKTGFGSGEDNLLKFFDAVDLPHRVILAKQLSSEQLGQMAKDKRFDKLIKEIAFSVVL